MKNIKENIAEQYYYGDNFGLEALKSIATKEDCDIIDKLIEDSWKICNGTYKKSEYNYCKRKENIFNKYGFEFNDDGLTF